MTARSMFDSLVNLVSGLGTSKDKTTANQYAFTELNAAQLEYAYRGDWLPRKIVDIPAKDATRAWRSWQAEADQISAIEDVEKRLGVQRKARDALIKARIFGGGAIVIGVDGAGQWSEELRLDRIKRGALKFLHVMDRYQLAAGEIETDVLSPNYGRPKYYTGPSSTIQIHPSRVVHLTGALRPSTRTVNDGWGDSVIQSMNDAIMNALGGCSALSVMMQEANLDVIKVPNFMSSIGTEEYRNRLIDRFRLAAVGQSVVRAKILDSEEEWNRVATSFTGVDACLTLLLQIVCGASDVPATRLMGMAPGGLNATGDSDTRNYYDGVADLQANEIEPALEILDEVIIRSALGDRPNEIYYDWRPLWQPTAAEKADIRLKNTQSLVNIYNTGLVPDEALSKSAINMLIEDGLLPGLEQAVEDAEGAGINEDDPEVQAQFADGEPKPLYVRRDVLNVDEITAWAKSQGITDIVPDLHVTIAYSRKAVNWQDMGSDWATKDGKFVVEPGGAREIEPLGSATAVLLFSAHALSYRNEEMRKNGASWDYPDYHPHVSISYGEVPDKIEPYRGRIVFGPEIFEELKENPHAT